MPAVPLTALWLRHETQQQPRQSAAQLSSWQRYVYDDAPVLSPVKNPFLNVTMHSKIMLKEGRVARPSLRCLCSR